MNSLGAAKKSEASVAGDAVFLASIKVVSSNISPCLLRVVDAEFNQLFVG